MRYFKKIVHVLWFFIPLNLFISCDSGSGGILSDDEDSNHSGMQDGDFCVHLKEAGTLAQELRMYNLLDIKKLTLYGFLDARDFRYLKENCKSVHCLDFTHTKILSYSGKSGTNEGYNYTYNQNEIPLGAFFYWSPQDEGMPSLRNVKIPSSVVSIRRNAFARAYNLTDVNFPEGLNNIDYVAFALCISLKEIKLPTTLKFVGKQAFFDCKELQFVSIKAPVPPTCDRQAFHNIHENAVLYVPVGSKEKYREAEGWDHFSQCIERTDL